MQKTPGSTPGFSSGMLGKTFARKAAATTSSQIKDTTDQD